MIEKIGSRINQYIEYLVFGLGLSMTIIVAVQVFFRYVLNHSLFWSEELARFLLVWLTFFGASCAYYRKANPSVDFIYTRLSPLLRKVSSILTHLASMSLFIVMTVYGLQFVYFVRLQNSPALQLPKWIILSVIPISGVILIIHAMGFLFTELKKDSHDH